MYRNVWLRLDALYASASNTRVKLDDISQTLEALGTEVDQVAQKTDSLHRETFFSAQNA